MKFTFRFLILAALLLTLIFYLISTSYHELPIAQLYSSASPSSSQSKAVPIEAQPDLVDRGIWKRVTFANANPLIHNAKHFPVLRDDDLVIVVQVHKRVDYLRALIRSMSEVKHIGDTLLIFSHDFHDEDINQLIASINFAKAVQIFYPFSNQIWHHTFPGPSRSDCSRDLAREQALSQNCSNAKYPDTYGHYREADVTQTKHHWWWKLNYLTDHFEVTKRHNGDFLFIEEDHYLMPDLVHTWRLMNQTKLKLVQNEKLKVDILTMGNYDKNYNARSNTDKLHFTEWFSSKHNMGFTISRQLWNKFKVEGSACFCTYDEYNWDWTLQHIIQECFDDNLLTLVSVVPRVFHIGTCGGMHHKKADCAIDKQVQSLRDVYSHNEEQFFPRNFTVMRLPSKKTKLVNNGGWSDPRDHQLCIQYELALDQIVKANEHLAPLVQSFNS